MGKVIQKCSGNCSIHAKAGLAVFRPRAHGGLWIHGANGARAHEESSGIIITMNRETVASGGLVNTGTLAHNSRVPSLCDV